MENDTLINQKVVQMLKLDSYHRRSVLNDWLLQLQYRNASKSLLNALSCLFDDKIASEVLSMINNSKFN
jgi:hypothetical protein